MSRRSRISRHHDAKNVKILKDKIKVKLFALRESRQEDDRFRSLQNEPYIDVWCDKISTDEKDYGSPSLKSVVLDFLKNSQDQVRSLDVFGESGSGKSIAMLKIEEALWDILEIDNIGVVPQFIPLFMILKTVTYPMYQNMMLREVALHSLGNILTINDLAELDHLKSQLKLFPVWLLDGFDEMGRLQSISTDLYECGISIVTCRQQFIDSVLEGNFEKYLTPKDSNGNTQGHFEQVRLLPFTETQIEEYLNKCVEKSSSDENSESNYKTQQVIKVINAFPSLKELSSNPYLLTLLCTLMPAFAEKHLSIKEILSSYDNEFNADDKNTRFGISDVFKVLVDALIAKGIARFVSHSDLMQGKFEDFPLACQHFCENVAFRMFEAKEKTYTIDMSCADSKDNDQPFGVDTQSFSLDLILQSIPLRRIGNSPLYAFPHKSLWEYFLACRSMRSPEETLGKELFTQDRDLLIIHAEVLAQHEKSVEEYIKIVLISRHKCDDPGEDKKRITSASNALSILNFAAADDLITFSFEGVRDWRGIRVPGVNLNHAIILRCEFDGADLSGASLIRAIIYASSFKRVDLRRATCGIKSILKGHKASVDWLSFHEGSEATTLASGSKDNSVRIWDIETGECTFASPHAERVWDSPMTSVVAFTSRFSNCIFLWDTITRKFCGVLEGHSRQVECFCFSIDGKIGASGSEDGTVRVWNIAEKTCIQILRAYSKVNTVTISPDGNKIASATSARIHFWDRETGNSIVKIKTNGIASMLYHPNGKLVAVFRHSSSIVGILDAETSVETLSIDVQEGISKISFLPDGLLIILAKSLKVWDIESNTCRRILEEKTNSDSTFALSRDLTTLVTVSSRKDNNNGKNGKPSFMIWDMKTFERVSCFGRNANTPNNICISHDNSFIIATYSKCSTFSLWDMKTGEETKINLGHVDNVHSVAFLPGTPTAILASSSEKGFRVWNKDSSGSWECFYKMQGDVGLATSTFSPDGKLIVGSDSGKFVVFDYDKKKIIRILSGTNSSNFAVFSPDGRFFLRLPSGRDKVEVFDTEKRRRLRTLDTDGCWKNASFSPDGRTIACMTDKGVNLVSWETGHSQIQIQTYPRKISFHPTNNRILASAKSDQVQFWDAFTGKYLMALVGHVGHIDSLCFTPDGSTLASGGENGSILLWDLTTNHCLPKASSRESPDLKSVCLSPDGRTLAAAGEGLYLYDVGTSKLIATLLSKDFYVDHVSFNSDGSLLVYGIYNEEGMVEIMDVEKKEAIQEFHGGKPSLNLDGTKVLHFYADIRVWDIAKSKITLCIDFPDHDVVTDACFSPDGSMIVAAFEESDKLHFWDVVTGQLIKKVDDTSSCYELRMSTKGNMIAFLFLSSLHVCNLEKAGELIASFPYCKNANFSADGNKLVFSRGESVIFIDMVTLKLNITLKGHSSDVQCIYVHPGGQYVVSCCSDMIFVWDLETMLPHSVMGLSKALHMNCDLQDAQLDETFRRTISNLFVHLSSSSSDSHTSSSVSFDKEDIYAYLEEDEEESDL